MYKLHYTNKWGMARTETLDDFRSLLDSITILDRNKVPFRVQARNEDNTYREIVLL